MFMTVFVLPEKREVRQEALETAYYVQKLLNHFSLHHQDNEHSQSVKVAVFAYQVC